MEDEFGLDVAKALMALLAELRAADCIDDLPDVDMTPTKGLGQSTSIQVTAGVFLKIQVNHTTPPMDASQAILWGKVSRIKIMDISDER
ncbi:hypothetical protein ACYG9R_00335 [Mesorhizobium sp. RSR565B]|uniref:hypothetical protein n=1 Tax=unclassified Mesorhizobium TaxID=325217 RepID=UPI000418F70B|nr:MULTISPECIES: hypothetical protein [unclassified Mesorhizobium]